MALNLNGRHMVILSRRVQLRQARTRWAAEQLVFVCWYRGVTINCRPSRFLNALFPLTKNNQGIKTVDN